MKTVLVRLVFVFGFAFLFAIGCRRSEDNPKLPPQGQVQPGPAIEDEEPKDSLPWDPVKGKAPASERRLKVAYLPATHDTLLFVALNESFFDAYGLKVDAKSFPNSPAALKVLQSGEFDLAIPGVAAPIYRINEGVDFQIIGGEAWYSAAIVSSSQIPPASGKTRAELLAGLKGKKVGTVLNSTGDAILKAAIKDADLVGSVKIVIFSQPPLLVEALRSGEVDAAMLWAPFMTTTIARSKGKHHIHLWASQIQDHPCCRQVVTGAILKSKEEEVVRYLCGIIAAKMFMLDLKNKGRVIAAVKQYAPGTPDEIIEQEIYKVAKSSGVAHRYTEVSPGIGREAVSNYVDMMKKAELISEDTAKSILTNNVKTQFLEKAYRRVFPKLTAEEATQIAEQGLEIPKRLRELKPVLGE